MIIILEVEKQLFLQFSINRNTHNIQLILVETVAYIVSVAYKAHIWIYILMDLKI